MRGDEIRPKSFLEQASPLYPVEDVNCFFFRKLTSIAFYIFQENKLLGDDAKGNPCFQI